jgi:hypothetical protein
LKFYKVSDESGNVRGEVEEGVPRVWTWTFMANHLIR